LFVRVLVTGAAGFIGYHVARALCERGDEVVGTDNLNDYYEVSLKEARLRGLEPFKNFRFVRLDLADRDGMSGSTVSYTSVPRPVSATRSRTPTPMLTQTWSGS
jgi:nucleoside-diphosphate-sugar epimerase